MGNDHRTRVTKILIRKAFTDLLKKKPIQSISIKELCEAAQINRGTFYTHYADIYDLLEKMEEEMMEESAGASFVHGAGRAYACKNNHRDFPVPEGKCGYLYGDSGGFRR